MYKERPDEVYGPQEQINEANAHNHEMSEDTRYHPTSGTLELQQNLATATFNEKLDADQIQLEQALLKEGIELKPEELAQLYAAIPELCNGINPELSASLKDLLPRLSTLIDQTAQLNKDGKGYEALSMTVEFLEKEQKTIEKIPNPAIRDMLLSYINAALNIEELSKKINNHAKQEALWGSLGIMPIVGSAIDIKSAATGEKPTGEKLTGKQRALQAAKGTFFLLWDLSGVVTVGAGTLLSSATKAAQAAEASGKTAYFAKVVMKFASLCHKIKNLNAVSVTIAKIGAMGRKYPRIAATVLKAVEFKKKHEKLLLAGELAYVGQKAARISYKAAKASTIAKKMGDMAA